MKSSIATTLLLVSLFMSLPASAQTFRQAEAAITPTWRSALALGDLDGDGRLDVIITGLESSTGVGIAKIYRNTSDGFVDSGVALPGTRDGSIDMADIDNDGDLDLLLIGELTSDVYRNDGNFTFTPLGLSLPTIHVFSIPAVVVNTPSAAFGDYDNDGDYDILLSGPGTSTFLYRNDGGVFTRITVDALSDRDVNSIEWGDYDDDGYIDLLVTDPFTAIYRNDINDGFTPVDVGLPPLPARSAKWGDYNNDGRLDILLAGHDDDNSVAVFRNLGDNQGFEEEQTSLPAAHFGDWIDFDHDGQRDILLNRSTTTGKLNNRAITLFRNVDAQGQFEQVSDELEGIWFGAVAIGDLNGDAALDILATGNLGNSTGLHYYQNATASPNKRPNPPGDLRSNFNQNDLVLEWTAGTDPDSPSEALTYNVRVGTTPGASDVLSAMARPDGTRLVAESGNAGHRTRLVVRDVDPSQTYYWSVQSVDASYAGSAFAEEANSAGVSVAVEGTDTELPSDVTLLGNYPNPFNPGTTIRYALPQASPVELAVFNMLGQKIVDLVNGALPAGQHEVYWDGHDARGNTVPSGLYLYRLKTPDQTKSRKMVLLK